MLKTITTLVLALLTVAGAWAGPLTLPLAQGAPWRTLTVLVESQPGQDSGVIGPALVEPGAP